ncbi:MAG: YcjF family protein [Rhodoferax sp.]|nr:YcjF family protein [Rhodoferax sp.]
MTKTASRALALLALFLVLYATASVVATVTQLSSAADRLYDGSGQIVFFSLLGIFGFLAAMPAALYFRLPKPLHPPATMEGPEFVEYQAGLLLALRRNPRLAGVPMDSVGDLAGALEALSKIADAEIKKSAGSIFVTTALMQNGKLDGLLMLATQARLVWRVAGIYYRRPSPRQMFYMYSNVGAAVLIATDIDDVDFAGMASPVVASIAPSLAGAVPGLQGIGSLLTNSLADGAANAFLTLRVGLIAKAYCAPMIEPQIGLIRRSASIQRWRWWVE